ncbi:MAG: hypothetical protein ABSE07_06015 [Methanoregula sp.]
MVSGLDTINGAYELPEGPSTAIVSPASVVVASIAAWMDPKIVPVLVLQTVG